MLDIKQRFLNACREGNIDLIDDFLEEGISPNTMDKDGKTALMLACINLHSDYIVKMLLENGANIYAQDINGKTALDYAIEHKNEDAEILIKIHHPSFVEISEHQQRTATITGDPSAVILNENKNNTIKSNTTEKNTEKTTEKSSESKNTTNNANNLGNPITEKHLQMREYEVIIAFCDELKGIDSTLRPFLYFKKAEALFALGKKEEATKVMNITQHIFEESYGNIENAKNWSKDTSHLYLKIIAHLAEINKNNLQKSLWLYNEAYHLSQEPEQKYEFKLSVEKIYERLVNGYDRSYKKKLVFVEDELPTFEPNFIQPLVQNKIGIYDFCGAAVQKGILYVAHPLKKLSYLPYQNAENALFEAQYQEILHILECLGAKSIKITFENDENASILQVFSPVLKPYLPPNLMWYSQLSDWKNLVSKRAAGVLNAEIALSAKDIQLLESFELQEMDEEFQDLVNFGYRTKNAPTRKRTRRGKNEPARLSLIAPKEGLKACKIYVDFADISDLSESIPLENTFVVQEARNFSRELSKEQVQEVKEIKEVKEVKSEEKIEEKIEEKHTLNTREPVKEISKLDALIEKVLESKSDIKSDAKLEAKTSIKSEKVETKSEKKQEIKSEEPKRDVLNVQKDIEKDFQKDEKQKSILEKTPLELVKEGWDDVDRKELLAGIREEMREDDSEKISLEEQMISEIVVKEISADPEGLSQEERYFYEMLQHAYQDGSISDDVRKVLERRRTRFNISLERADQLEKMMLNKK